ncbi:polyketide synthase [Streptomyces sp. NBC_01353]|uniref:polyketide synthase n=1 Tax=Streptomyces sp. NBC_01353 TaxID=2903835 RepID=UPI002E3691EE|nr:polyketide synthase [Streptomyces sp. NBC_01353]
MAANCFIIGSTRVLTQCAAQLLDAGVRIEGVFSDDPAVSAWAGVHAIPVLDPHGDLSATLSAQPFDYLFSMVNFRILPASILDLPTTAAINFHDGPLPRYSGSHVPAWALYEGASRHAATWHRMTEAVDAGGVLLERWFPVRDHSTALSLTYETAEVGIELFADLVPHVVARTLPEPIDTSDRERRFYRRSARMASGGLIHAGTPAVEAVRLSKALDYGSFPNPLGVPTLVTEQGAVFTRQVRLIPREDPRTETTVLSVTTSAITLSAPDADLVLSDCTAIDGSALSGQAAAQRLGIAVGSPLPAVSAERLADIAAAQKALRAHEPWWRARLEELRPAPLPADDFSAAGAHYGRYELAFVPGSREEAVAVVRAFLTVVAERTGEQTFDFAWSPPAARVLGEQTHGIAAARFPVRFDGDTTRSLRGKLDEAATRHGYASDLELRLGLAGRPLGSDEPSFTRVMVLDRSAGEEASAEPHTEIALLCLQDGPPTVFVRETAMGEDEALEFTEQVEELVLTALLHGEEPQPEFPSQSQPHPESQSPSEAQSPEPLIGQPDSSATPSAAGTVLDLFAATVADRPGATAVRSGTRTLDYAGLDAWADAVAARLHDQGIESGSVVGVLMERDLPLLPAMLGILRAGAAFLPLDPGYPVERLQRYVEVSQCDLIVTDTRTHALGASLGPALNVPEPDGSAQAVPPLVTASDLAYLLFTSGSTGNPKGVEVEHGALANFLTGIGERLGVSPDDTLLAHTTVAFDISLLELFLGLTVGATVVLASRETAGAPARLAELIGDVTFAQATPSLWRLLLGTGWTPHAELTVLSGGEALPPATAERLHGPARALWNLYGPTEATIWASCHQVTSVGSFLPLGEPLPNMELHVLNGELEACAAGATGELYLSGAGLARGYAGRPDLTKDVFIVHPVTGVRLYRTGDEVRLHADGAIEWLGRGDAQVKVRGNRIEPAEIERVLEKFEGVTAAVVVAARFEGRGEPRLTAYLVGDGTPTKSQLDAFVGASLPGYMVPDAYVDLDALPLTDNGKVARAKLPLPTRDTIIPSATPEPAATPVGSVESVGSVEPSEPTVAGATAATGVTVEALAESIARVFAATLDHPGFGVHANFFDLGGDSVNVTFAAVQLGRELGTTVTAPSIFASGTPLKLARLLGAEGVVRLLEPEAEVAVTVRESADPEPVATSSAASAPAVSTPAVPITAEPVPAESARPAADDGALAVIGMACRFPGAATPDEFWQNLVGGVSSVGHAPDGKRGWAHLWSEAGADDVPMAWVDGVEYFDAARFGLTDREARRMDPLQRTLLSVTSEALESCGHDHVSLGAATGVFIGTIASDFPEIVERSIGHRDPHVATGTAASMVANRLSHVFDWSGPSFAVDTACSSSLVALHQAAMHLRAGDVDAAVVGAANLVLTPTKTRSFARNGMLSPQGMCRTFDDAADGYVRGEGTGAVVLKRLADAERDGDPVLAVIRGTAVNHTGGSAGFLTAPSRPAQEAVLRKALAGSGRTAADIGYIEAHGTGTQLGDLIELEALHAVLGEPADRRPVALGSVKTNIGHLEPAAGIAGLIKTILALQAAHIPPSLNFSTPNKSFDFDASPLFVADRLLPWGSGPRVAGISSFGFGGANAHAVVEAGPVRAPDGTETGPRLLVLSAGSDEALRTLAHRLVLMLRSAYCPSLDELSEASRRRPAAAHRLACVADSVEQLEDKLQLFLAGVADIRSLHVGVASETGATEPIGAGASREALAEAARAFVAGAALPAGRRRRAGVRFPTAPHAEKHLWLEPAEQPNEPPARDDGASGSTKSTWTEHPEAAEHLVLGKPTLPGAGYPGKVAELLGQDRFGLRDLTFRAAVEAPATLTAERGNATVAFRDGTGALVCNAELTGTEQMTLTAPATSDGLTSVALDAMYDAFERAGLSYGAGFRTVSTLSVAPGQAMGVLRGDGRTTGAVDARLLDGAFQIALAACGAQGLYVPFTIERLTVLGRLPDTARVYARRERDAGPDSGLLTASLVILDGDEPVLEARGITWKRLSPAPSSEAAGGDTRNGHRAVPTPTPAPTPAHVSNGHRPMPAPGRSSAGGLDAALAEWVAAALELDVDELETDRPLQEQGLDSMLAVSLAQDIRARLDVDIPVTLVLEVGTVDRLAAELRDEYGVTAAPADAGSEAAGGAPRAAVSEQHPEPASEAARALDVAPEPARAPDVPSVPAQVQAVEPSVAPVRGDAELHDIAVIGFDGVFPNAANTEELWQVLLEGVDCLSEVPASRWDIDSYYGTEGKPGTVYLRRAGFVEGLNDFDAGFFRLSPAEAEWIDPQQRHLVQSAWRALEDAGLAGHTQRSTGVFVGASYQHYRDMVVGDVVQTAAGLGNHNAILANRVSFFLDLHGPSMTIDTLCSSSLVALHTAVRSIRDGECEQAIVAGVHMAMSPQYFQLGARLRSFSPTHALRPFDAGADGFVPGEGVVTVVVKPLGAALRDGDRVRGVIRGSAVNHGGRTSGLTVPSSAAQQGVIAAALGDAGVSVESIGLVEAHGTGTSLGDPIEVEGLTRAWRGLTGRSQFCAIGSLKGNVGHLEPAAGLAGLVKVLLALEHGVVPPSLHVVRPNDHIRFEETPFYLADRAQVWPRGVEPRRAAVSAFGMGGVNAHVIVEEPPVLPERGTPAQDSYVVRVSAADETALRSLADAYSEALADTSDEELGDFAFTANTGRAGHRYGVAVQGADARELAAGLNDVVTGRRALSRKGGKAQASAFMFTGQGSQYLGMGRGLYAVEPVFRAALDECAELLAGHVDVPLLDLLFGDVPGRLDRTGYAQPAIVSVQVGLVRWLESVGVRPDAVVGHSLGELTAAWAAGVLGLADLLRLTAIRGRLMESQPGQGAMAVVHADAEAVLAAITAHPGVEIAAFNAPRVVTITGPADAVTRFCRDSGLRSQPLTVSHAFHSAAMQGAVAPFVEAVAATALSAPVIPFASTVTGDWHTAQTATDPGYWGRAIREPVRFSQALTTLADVGPAVVWEIGSHPQLTSLAKASWGETQPVWITTLQRGRTDQVQLHGAVAEHYNHTRTDLDWAGLHEGKGRRTTTIPTYPFNRQELAAPPARRSGTRTSAPSHPLFDRHYEHQSEGQ